MTSSIDCKPRTVRGAVLSQMGCARPYEKSKPLQIETLTLADPGPGEVLVRVLAAGLCHSDLSVINGSRPRPLPMVLGHEGCGEVVALGPPVANNERQTTYQPMVSSPNLKKGDRVVFSFVPSCGACSFCLEGRDALCQQGAQANAAGLLLGGESRWLNQQENKAFHHLGVSAFAELTVLSIRSVVIIDKDLPPDIAALFGCAVLTGVGAVFNTAAVQPGQSVSIFGLGGVGLAALLGAKAAGAGTIIAVDILQEKLQTARELGATHTFLASQKDDSGKDMDVVKAIKDATTGGADFTFETAGHETALKQAYEATRRGGTTIAVGLPHPDKMFAVPAASLVAEERVIKGSYMGSAVPARDIPRFIEMYRQGKLPVDKLLTHRLNLSQINEGFERLARGEAIRQMILFEQVY